MSSEKKLPIKHLVISGGCHSVFCTCGAIEELIKTNTLKISDIETVYASSAGGVVAAFLCLNFDWDIVKEYLIKRPWHEAFPITTTDIFAAYSKRGVFDKKYVETIFKPLLNAKDLSMNITMKELYEYSKIEIHLFSVELHDFKTVDISYKTHPNLSLLTALYMSSSLPIIFAPCLVDDKCYIDGGIITNYPLQLSLDAGHSSEEILGFKNEYDMGPDYENAVNENSTILDYITFFLYKLISTISTEHKQSKIPNEITYKIPCVSFFYMKKAMESQETREDLWQRGVDSSQKFRF